MGMNSAVSCWSGQQPCDSEQIVGGADQIGVHLHALAATVARFAQTADGLHPAESLLDSFPHPLTDRITRMPGGARVERGTPRPRVILCHVRSDLECAARRDEAVSIVALVPSQSNSATARQPLVGHRLRRAPLSRAVRRLDLKVDQQEIAVLGQRVGRVAKLGFLALTLACQQRLRIGGRLMSRVGTMLAVKVHGRVTRIIRRRARFLILALEALQRGPGFDQRPINGKVLVREQSERVRLRDSLPEELASNFSLQQALAVSTEARMIEARLVQLHVQKPAEQQIVVELLTEQPLAANRIQRHQQRSFEQTLGRNRRTPQHAVDLVKDRRQLSQRQIRHLLDARQRMLLGNSLFQVHYQQHRPLSPFLAAHPPLPPAALHPSPQTKYAKLNSLVFQQPAKGTRSLKISS